MSGAVDETQFHGDIPDRTAPSYLAA
jgi:hypothetical protein